MIARNITDGYYMNRKKHQILKILLLCLISSKSSASEKELNLQFIRHKFGQNTEDIELFFNSSTVLPGNYTVDVKLNDEVIGRAKLEVSQDDKESYCLKDEWLSDLGIIINRDFYNKYFNIKRECYEIGKEKTA